MSYDINIYRDQMAHEEPPTLRELIDGPDLPCPKNNPEEPCEPTICYLCAELVCREHDEVDRCDDDWVHDACHRQGCDSLVCAQDARDDAAIDQADAAREAGH